MYLNKDSNENYKKIIIYKNFLGKFKYELSKKQ